MELQSRKLSKLGLLLVLFGVAAATFTVMTVAEGSTGGLIPRSLEISDVDNPEEAGEEEDYDDYDENDDYDDYDDDDDDRRGHHCHKKILKVVAHFVVLFFALFGLGSCLRVSFRAIRGRSRRGYRHFEGYHHHHQEMQRYPHPQAVPVQPQVPSMAQPNRYPNLAPYGQPVNPQ